MVNIPLFTGFYTSQVVQDFFHHSQQCVFISFPLHSSSVDDLLILVACVNKKRAWHRATTLRWADMEPTCPLCWHADPFIKRSNVQSQLAFSYVIQMENVSILWGVPYKLVPPCTYTHMGCIARYCPQFALIWWSKLSNHHSHFAHHLISPPRGIGRFQIQM